MPGRHGVLLSSGAQVFAKATGSVAVACDAQGAEHLAVQSTESVLYARTCASPR